MTSFERVSRLRIRNCVVDSVSFPDVAATVWGPSAAFCIVVKPGGEGCDEAVLPPAPGRAVGGLRAYGSNPLM